MTTSTNPSPVAPLEFDSLRAEAVRHLQQLCGDAWTDFNDHDPGVTILEQFCYALTDLSYRINYDIRDLLADGTSDPWKSLPSPRQILTTRPVTLMDLRKLVIDVPGVRNAWIKQVKDPEPKVWFDRPDGRMYFQYKSHRDPVSIRGIYDVQIEFDPQHEFSDAETQPWNEPDLSPQEIQQRKEAAVADAVNQTLHAHRNLCEDFQPPVVLKSQEITVNANIEIGDTPDPARLLAEIRHQVAEFISPRIKFYSVAEMIERGKRVDEIFDGPKLDHGFIDSDELQQFERRTELRSSDLIRLIMRIDGVLAVRDMTLEERGQTNRWFLKLDPEQAPCLSDQTQSLKLQRNRAPVRVDHQRMNRLLTQQQQTARLHVLPLSQRDLRPAKGRDRNVKNYHSIQHQFPANYGIGEGGLPASASPQRKAQANQLKAYLMFFDQLLANGFMQLAHAKDLFSFDQPNATTYFSQIPDDSKLSFDDLRNQDRATHEERLQKATEYPHGRDAATADQRKNRFLDHLLARFGEQFTDYSLQTFAVAGEHFSPDAIADKSAFLEDYHEISSSRGGAVNQIQPHLRSDDVSEPQKRISNVSGLERRIRHLLGMEAGGRPLAKLNKHDAGGFHLVEHILLRPRPADKTQWTDADQPLGQTFTLMADPVSADPWSAQVSFVIPNWLERFSSQESKDFVWRVLREETPAHIVIHLHWLDRDQMKEFEAAFQVFLNSLAKE